MGFINITLKNFRCFEDSNPISIDIGRGFTALVGPNNCGKSSFLKFFYEFRGLFAFNAKNIIAGLNDELQVFTVSGVEDLQELPCNFNQRDGSITLHFEEPYVRLQHPGGYRYKKVDLVFKWARNQPSAVTCEIFTNGNSRSDTDGLGFGLNGVTLRQGRQEILEIRPLIEEINKLQNSMYFGPFRNAINQGSAEYFDLQIGDQFIKRWNEWKTGPERQRNHLIEKVTEDLRNIFNFQKLEINAAASGKELALNIDGYPYKLRELGAGLSQFILVFANAAMRRPAYIFIDEPELNLHPSLQVDFLTSLASYATEGVVFCTHSIGLARTVADRIYSLQRSGRSIRCSKFEQTPNYAEFAGEMSFSSFKELGFERIVLVEGQSEVRTIHQFLRMLKKDHQIVVIPLGGSQMIKDNVEQELAELKRITNKVSAIIDSERSGPDAELDKNRKGFEACCKRLGIEVLLTERRATENYFTDSAIKNAISDSCRALEPYEAFKGASAQWSKSQNWRIAREMKWEDIAETDLGKFLSKL